MYLAGPITGCTRAEVVDWREEVARSVPVECISPLRGKHLPDRFGTYYKGQDEMKHCLSGPRGILSRDYWDVHRCDILFANGTSTGTIMEIAWAYTRRIPIVCVLDQEHPMLMEAITHRVKDLQQGIEVVKRLV